MGIFDNLKQLGQATKFVELSRKLQKNLEKIQVTVEHKGVTVVISGTMKVISISGHNDLQAITEAVNEAIKQVQKLQEEEGKKLFSALGFPKF